jgi:hypothetical protein
MHDTDCPGCGYERRREINKVAARITDYRTKCSECGVEIIGELEHRVKGQVYCWICVGKRESPSAE